MLPERLTELKRELAEYAGLVEQMVDRAMKSLVSRDRTVCETVLRDDEERANAWEVKIDEMCTVVIAQFEPVARDLRTVLMILKANNDLERMADHAVNICESSSFLIERPPVKPLIDLPRMGSIASSMLRDAISSFVTENASLAQQVCERDEMVDDLRDQIFRELLTYMVSDPSTVERSLHYLRISENLERIADLSTNISEDTIFMVEGRIIKHHRVDIKKDAP